MAEPTPQDTVIACISNSISAMLGRGSRAAMREAGKAASHEIWPTLPENQPFEEVARIMHDGVAALNGFGDFNLKAQHDDGSFEIEFQNCGFSQYTEQSGEACGEQPICFFGYGLVEETLRRMTGNKMQVKLINRDDTGGICQEVAVPR